MITAFQPEDKWLSVLSMNPFELIRVNLRLSKTLNQLRTKKTLHHEIIGNIPYEFDTGA